MASRRRLRSTTIPKSDGSLPNSPTALIAFHKPSLGDKLQWLAARSPRHVRALEAVVDLMLLQLKSRTRYAVPLLMLLSGG